jgi:uncharacterized protein (TIGR02145 family)
MRRIFYFAICIFLFYSQVSEAQDYKLNFLGRGDSQSIDSVLVENLIQGTFFTVYGSDGLMLRKTLLGIDKYSLKKQNLRIYPNPSSGNTIIEFSAITSDMGHVELYDLSGKRIFSYQQMFETGSQSFNLSGLTNGIFLVRVYAQSYNYIGKIISINSNDKQCMVSFSGTETKYFSSIKKSVSTIPQMQYNLGERLKLTGYSGKNSTVISIIPEKDTTLQFNFISCTDGDGSNYPVVQIGNQLWMAENLMTSKYEDSTPITYISQDSEWINLSTPAFCYYEFDASNKSRYGSLYNRFTFDEDINGGKNVCPKDWHVPIDAEWTTLSEFLGNNSSVGGKLKETGLLHWENPNSLASNETGFTGLPGGGFFKESNFIGLGFDSYCWSSTNVSKDSTWYRIMKNDNGEFGRFSCPKISGLSIRCVNDLFYGKAVVPVLTTINADSITGTSVSIGGDISFDGGATVISRGICWSTHSNSSLSDSFTKEGVGSGTFSSRISGLLNNTNYYARSYAINNVGTGYGNEIIFKTLIELPALTTSDLYNIYPNSVTCGGKILSNGGDSIIARGVCWSTHKNPTITDNKTSDGSGSGSYISYIDSLIPSTTYYIRSYAINSKGVNYGNEIVFKTSKDEPVLTTNTVTNISMSSATSGGNITHDGGKPITSRGICWSKNFPCTINDDKTVDGGSGEGSFSCQISGLSVNTSYYVRAYAINEDGVFYANGYGFKTSKGPEVKFTSVSWISTEYAYFSGEVISDGGNKVKERGFCWSTSRNPTINDNKKIAGEGIGVFESSIHGLLENTCYYVRAFATNNIGTSYSDVSQFRTKGTVTDIDNNVYTTVTIGNQEWMVENLKTTKYNNGVAIPLVNDNTEWSKLNTAAYYPYSSDVLGYFYNYFTIADSNNVCPIGWHVPSGEDWGILYNLLGGWEVAGGSMKSTSDAWESPNTKATNLSGFTGLPTGLRRYTGQFEDYRKAANWWSTEIAYGPNGYGLRLWYGDANCKKIVYYKTCGLSIRCIKDK